ncbi:MAG: mandelate racemase/muconate lactonizing enzyme family protein [Acidobacteria bacterium]|nr:mandelate racemase/muconate lactonizing enzyme family protein [Acidobacteriota bacterium]
MAGKAFTRRQWLSMAAAVPAAASVDWEAPAWEAPLFDWSRLFTGPIKIARIEVLERGKAHFVRAVSTDGVVGVVRTKEIEDFLPILLRRIAPFFQGKDARQLERLMDDLYIAHYKISGQAFWSPAAAVEHAVLDMLGRTARKPVAELLGGMKRSSIPVYLSGSGRDTSAEQEVQVYVDGMKATGAAGFKLKIGGRMSRNADATPGRTEKMLTLARKLAGDKAVLYADANGSYDYREAVRVGRVMEELKYAFYEEPSPWEELSLTKRVADTLTIPVAGGECDQSLWRYQWMVDQRAVDIIQPDLNYCGGILRAARIARMAAKANMPIVPHNTQTDAAACKIMQFAAAIPNIGPFMEFPWREEPKPASWYTPNFVVRGGAVKVPATPGLGVEFDADYLKTARVLA